MPPAGDAYLPKCGDSYLLKFGETKLPITSIQNNSSISEKMQEYLYKKDIFFELQYRISDFLGKWEPNDNHQLIVKKILSYDSPILTTNYDKLLSLCVDDDLYMPKNGFSKIHPWTSYFSNRRIDNPLEKFGIWHINGTILYPSSIKLGLCQYMSAISSANKMVHSKGEIDNFNMINSKKWIGHNTWLNIVFNKSLFIFGLALDENEVFLRWLLIQRAKYFLKFPDRKYKGWFIITEKDIKDGNSFNGKKFFLEKVGIETIVVPNYKYLYEDIWK